MKKDTSYNGWKNRSTWNVVLWLFNDYYIYKSLHEFMQTYKGKKPYVSFIDYMGMRYDKTGDNIKFISNRLDYKALNEMMWEEVKK